MNILIVGLPGNGKGVKAMQLIVDELRLGTRPIITNLAVEKLPWVTGRHESRRGFRDYLLQKYGEDFNCCERIFRVSSEAIKNFYLYRALTRKQVEKLGAEHLVGYRQVTAVDEVMTSSEMFQHQDYQLYVCDHVTKVDKAGKMAVTSFNARLLELSGGHFSVADECWAFWPARGWQSTSETDVAYNAQHRHYGDDNLFLTQRHNDIDSIIVERCQESIVMTHHGKMSFSVFRQPDLFSESIYNGRPMPSKEPMTRRVFRLDVKGLCQGYDTSAGVGITGRGAADMGSRKRGLPFWVLPVAAVVLVLAVGFGVVKGSHLVTGFFTHGSKSVAKIYQNTNSPAGSEKQFGPLAAASEKQARPQTVSNVPVQLSCCGYSVLFGRATAFLSDGRVVDSSTGLDAIGRDVVYFRGQILPIVARPLTNSSLPEVYPDSVKVVPMPGLQPSSSGVSVYYFGDRRSPNAASGSLSAPGISRFQNRKAGDSFEPPAF